MKARLLLAALALASLFTSCSRHTSKTITWTLQSQATEESIDFIELKSFAQEVEAMSSGRFVIKALPGSENAVSSGPDIFVAVKEGRIEMGNGWPNWWSGQHPSWAVMNAGPFDFMNLDASMMFFLAGPGTDLANELAEKDGVVWRPAWWPGMEFGLMSNEPINNLDDLNGKRVRIGPGLPSEVFVEAAHASAIPLVPQEIRPALEVGSIDAVEWTTTRGVLDLGLSDISPHAIVPAIWQPSVLSDFLIDREAFDSLPNDLRHILESAIKSYTLTTTLKSKVADIEALDTLKKQGVSIRHWTDSDIDRWREANDTIIEEYRRTDEYTRKLIDSKREFKTHYNEYYEYFGKYD